MERIMNDERLSRLAQEYEERCEAFDATIGMGGYDRRKWTSCNYPESSRNARNVLNEIAQRDGISKAELLEAIRFFNRSKGH